jgi:hypothetical protein
MNVQDIRFHYRTPTKVGDSKSQPKEYCVLGAAILYKNVTEPSHASWKIRFPTPALAVHELGIPYQWAEAITDANDNENFEIAWQLLDQALRLRGEIDGLW